MSSLKLTDCTQGYYLIETDIDTHIAIYEKFTYSSPGFQFDIRFKSGLWDGKVHLYSTETKLFPKGLYSDLIKFCKANDITYSGGSTHHNPDYNEKASLEYLNCMKFTAYNESGGCNEIHPRDYQIKGYLLTEQFKRKILISSTGTGKSLMIYLMIRSLHEKFIDTGQQILLIVPTIALVTQMFKDFEEYSYEDNVFNVHENIHCVTAKTRKESDKPIVISTFQSIDKESTGRRIKNNKPLPDKNIFENYGAVIIDEVHRAKAESYKFIMDDCVNAEYRYGLTGSMNDKPADFMTVRSLIGNTAVVATTKEETKKGNMSPIKVNVLKLHHTLDISNFDTEYMSVTKYLDRHKIRNSIIVRYIKPNENTMIFVSKKIQANHIIEELTKSGHEYIYLDDKSSIQDREDMRIRTEENTGIVVVGSYKLLSTGINIKNLHTIMFASSTKSSTTVIQSVGRNVRKHESKSYGRVMDFVDVFSTYVVDSAGNTSEYNTNRIKYFENHYNERKRMYEDDGHTIQEANLCLERYAQKLNKME